MLTNYSGSTNIRHRFNGTRVIQWFAREAPPGEPRDWAALELTKLIQNKSLYIPSSPYTYSPSPGYETNGSDVTDDTSTPLHYVLQTLGELKDPRAIPCLEAMIERGEDISFSATTALGQIGDPSAGPFLLKLYKRTGSQDFVGRLIRISAAIRGNGESGSQRIGEETRERRNRIFTGASGLLMNFD
ncbi:MAG: hypothetical protein C5B50_22510 [Verrucomicrobia bacterium]|nr:MAG: hypothetical protein C5B50_22510 [Verrucomicrobiota bacterium]